MSAEEGLIRRVHDLENEASLARVEVRKALALVREAGDCLLLAAPVQAKDRIYRAAVILHGIGGE